MDNQPAFELKGVYVMDWKIFFIKFIRNIVIGLILGGFEYLLAGREGLGNMTYWGIALGLIGGFSSGIGLIFEAHYWGEGNYKVFPEWNWFIKKSEDGDKKSKY